MNVITEDKLDNMLLKDWIDNELNLIAPDFLEYGGLIDKHCKFPKELINTLQEKGLFKIIIPHSYGGLGGNIADAIYAIESTARICASTATIMMFHYQVVKRIMDYGTENQKNKYLPQLANTKLGASAWTEPNSGANKHGLSASIKADGEDYILDGRKSFCTGAGKADLYTVLVKTEMEKHESKEAFGLSNQSFIIIESDDKGLEFGESWDGMGLRGTSTGELTFNQCRLPKDRILGNLGDGTEIFRANRNSSIHPGIMGLGLSKEVFELVLEYANKRNLTQYQSVRFQLVEMKINIETMQSLIYKSGNLSDSNQADIAGYYAMQSKVVASQNSFNIINSAMQIFGGRGYLSENKVERFLRDSRALSLMGPVSELCKEIIFNDLNRLR